MSDEEKKDEEHEISDEEELARMEAEEKKKKSQPGIHEYPCVCTVKGRRRKSLTKEELKEKTKLYLRDPAKASKQSKKPKKEEDPKKKARRERLEKLKKEKKIREELLKKLEVQKANFLKLRMSSQVVEGTDYFMEYVYNMDELMKKRAGKINYKKKPIYQIKPTKASNLKRQHRRYCGKIKQPRLPPMPGSPTAARTMPTPKRS